MFEDETEHENDQSSINLSHHMPPVSAHLHDAGSLPLVFEQPPSPTGSDQLYASSRCYQSPGHRRRSGSVPCRRPRDHLHSARQVRGGTMTTTTSTLLHLPAISVPQIIVNDQTLQPTADYEEVLLLSKDVQESPVAFRPRCQTVSLDPTYRSRSPTVLPCRRRSLSTNLSTSGTLYTGEWIRVLLQRTDAGRQATHDVLASRAQQH